MSERRQTVRVRVRGITCADCVTRIARGVGALPGVEKVRGNLDRRTVTVVFDADAVPVGEIVRAIEGTGYAVEGVEP